MKRACLRIARPSRTSFLIGAALAAALLANGAGRAATPPSGSVASGGTVNIQYAPVVAGTYTDTGVEAQCPPGVCDNFDLTVSLPQPAQTYYQTHAATLTVTLSWTSQVDTDLDLFGFSPSGAKHGPGAPDVTLTGPNQETLTINDPLDGVWHLRSFASLSPLPVAATAVVTLTTSNVRPPPNPPPPRGAPAYVNYAAPENITPALGSTSSGAHGAGEPSIGVNWKTGSSFFQAGNHTLRVRFDDTTSPASASWADKRSPYARESLDPILWGDGPQGRIFESQLIGACSVTSFSDDDGETWTPTEGCGVPNGPDHQTIGGGNYAPAGKSPVSTYPHAVYYCSQGIADAICARSDDGGLTFGPGIPIYNITQCNGLHGHVKVSPDGTAYVPNKSCKDAAGVARNAVVMSPDNGLTWAVETIPLSKSTGSAGGDPAAGTGAADTLYTGFVNFDGHPKISISRDHGRTWSKPADVGTRYGIQNAEFPEVVAGDDNRATFAFLGTPTPGDDQSSDFPGVWHLYVATTYDGGRTWLTEDATPTDPVQRGCIWNGGGSNQCRNLLDFNDIALDPIGRVEIGYADGCTGACVSDPGKNTYDALATIARQATGKTMFSAYDGKLP